MKHLLSTLVLGALASSCIVAPNARPEVRFGASAWTQYNFRGVPLSDDGALQGDVRVSLPTTDEGTLDFHVFGNLNLSNDNGGGVLPDNAGFEVTRQDYIVSYTRQVQDMTVTGGLTHYTFPAGGKVGGAMYGLNYLGAPTTQIYGQATIDRWDLAPTLAVFFDIDEGDGVYLNASVSREYDIDDRTWAVVQAGLGASTDNVSNFYYGSDRTGLADLGATGQVNYQYAENIVFHGTVGVSTLVNSRFDDALDAAGIDSDNIWLGVGSTWSF